MTRRSFLKGGAIVAGSIAGVEVLTPLLVREHPEFDANASIWVQAQPPKNPPLDHAITADVAVIGGGYTGLSAAYHLARRFPRRTIVLVEARAVGQGASGRNGGMLLPQTSNEFMEVYSNPRRHKLIYDLTVANLREIQSLLAEHGAPRGLNRCGALLVISNAIQVQRYRDYTRTARELGIPVEFWDREQTRQAIGTDVYHGALYEPNAGQVHPMLLVSALKQAAEAAGVHIYEDSPVREIIPGEVVRLQMGTKTHIDAKRVVLATNGYTSKLGFFRNRVVPLHTHIAVTPPLPADTFAALGWKGGIPYIDTRNILYHLGVTPDNRIMIGSGHVHYFFNNGTVYRGDLQEPLDLYAKELTRIYPALKGIRFEKVWSGITDFTLDFNPAVGVTGEHRNIYYAIGYCGHGVNLATLCGRIIAELTAGESEPWIHLPFCNRKPPALPPEPLKWLTIQLLLDYYRMLDDKGMGGRT